MRDQNDDSTQRTGVDVVTARAALDRDFRRELLTDPHVAIHHAFGVELPRALRLKFIERDPDVDLMIVLPDLVDEVFDGVAGGATPGAREAMSLLRARWP
jgi:hypothetical protein